SDHLCNLFLYLHDFYLLLLLHIFFFFFFFFNIPSTTEIYTLSLHDALPIFCTGASFIKAIPILGGCWTISRSCSKRPMNCSRFTFSLGAWPSCWRITSQKSLATRISSIGFPKTSP